MGDASPIRDGTPVSGWWPWPGGDTVSPPEHPLLLLPGICGTILNVRKKGERHEGKRAWVAIEYADYAYRQLWGRYNQETGQVESFEEELEVLIPSADKNGGLWPIDILDPDLYVPLHVVYYYHAFIRQFHRLGYTPSQDLFGFGYDFRQCNLSHCETLLQKLRDVSRQNGGKRVDVVTHSMGGLVMKSLLALYPAEFEQLVNRWIAVATPFGGAPGFVMGGLLTGVQFTSGWQEHFFVERNSMLQMAVQSPAVHQMMPSPKFEWPIPPPIARLWLKDPETEKGVPQQFTLGTFPQLMEQVLVDNVAVVEKQKYPNPMNPGCWEAAAKAQQIWSSAKLPASCQFFNISGAGFDTPYDVSFGSEEHPLTSITEARIMVPDNTYVDGDSTVPVVCAMADGLDATERQVVTGPGCSHRALIENPEVWDLIYKWLSGAQIPRALLLPMLPDPMLACAGGQACQCMVERHPAVSRPDADSSGSGSSSRSPPDPPSPHPPHWWCFWRWFWWRHAKSSSSGSCAATAAAADAAVRTCCSRHPHGKQVVPRPDGRGVGMSPPPSRKSLLMAPLLPHSPDTSVSPGTAAAKGAFQISAVSADGRELPVDGSGPGCTGGTALGQVVQCAHCGRPRVDPVHVWMEEHHSLREAGSGAAQEEEQDDWVVVCSMKALACC